MLLAIFNFISVEVFPEDYVARAQIGHVLEYSRRVSAITAGASVNRAVLIEELNPDGRHAWLPGTDLFEASVLIRELETHLENLQTVYLGLPRMLWYRNDSIVSSVTRRKFYKTIVWLHGRPAAGDWKPYATARFLPLIRADHWSGLARSLLSKTGLTAARPEADVVLGLPESADDPVALNASSQALASQFCPEIRMMREAGDGTELSAFFTLEQLSAWARRRNILLVIYRPPVWWRLLSLIDGCGGTFHQSYEDSWSRAGRLPNVYLFTIDDYDAFSRNSNYFADPMHLNRAGAEAYTRRLDEALRGAMLDWHSRDSIRRRPDSRRLHDDFGPQVSVKRQGPN